VFTHFLVKGLQGEADLPLAGKPADGIITFAELSAYVANNTYAHVFDKFKVRQSPELRGDYDLNLPLARIQTGPNAAGIEFVRIPAGSFRRGSEEGADDEKPVRTIRISKPFYAANYEVTIGQALQWLNAPGVSIDEDWVTDGGDYSPVRKQGAGWVINSASKFGASENQPMQYISWDGAVAFCEWCSRQDPRFTYRLPTEAEWEYMARAGSTTAYPWGDSLNGTRANVDGNFPHGTETKGPYREITTNVGSYAANRFGLYDTVGNVYEWCSDWYDAEYYGSSPVSDPSGPGSGSSRVLRGGSWLDNATLARSAHRINYSPDNCSSQTGRALRVICGREVSLRWHES
jgi:formylglycine-generating enzyme required for sulfatase activity